jgi:hypothetical protein
VIAEHFPARDSTKHWVIARSFVLCERHRIDRVAEALAWPPYRLNEAEFIALVSEAADAQAG